MKKSFFTTVIFLWSASFLSLQAQDCAAPPAPFVNWSGCDKSGENLYGANLTSANLSNAILVGADMTDANLSGANVSGANLSNVNFIGAGLSGLNLTGANLAGALLVYTHLDGANLSGLNLVGANLTGANLDNADLSNVDLTGVTLLSAIMPGANLSGANLSSTELSSTIMSGAILTGAILTGANVTGANLNGVDLSGADLSGIGIYGNNASFYNSDLTGANLTGANLTNMDLRNINISGADLTGAILTGVGSGGITGTPSALPAGWQLINGYLVGPGANLTNANLAGANLSGVNLTEANLSNANLVGADMTDANLSGANVSGADLSGATFSWASLQGANLNGANLTGASFTGTNFENADLSNANLTSANLLVAILTDANLNGANLNGVASGGITGTTSALPAGWLLINGYLVGPGANLSYANFTGENLSGLNLVGATLYGTTLSGANLSGANLTDANLSGTNLTGAILTGVVTGGITGTPSTLPAGWQLINGYLVIIPTTDSPMGGTLVQYSSNANYPTCYPIASTTAGATDSPESVYAGPDIWYRFTAQSTAAVVTMSSASMDDAIALYSRDNGGNYIFVGSTNASEGAGDFERLVVSGLTPGTMYYASLGSSDGTSGAFQVCVQHLMPSGCASTSPVGGFSLCDSFKARYRGAVSQGVTYDFTFFDEGYNTTNTLSGTNGLITLSNPTLGLRWGALLDARVDVNYQLQNSAGTPVNVSVLGNANEPSCQNFFIRNAPQLEVRTSQRCPATLLRSNWLVGQRLLGGTQACGAIGYTYEFTQVTNCNNTEPVGLPFTVNTAGATPYLQLGVLPNLSTQGAWKVRIASKYATINDITYTSDFGPEQYIVVNGTSAIEVLDEQEAIALAERNAELVSNMAMYPNPNSGNLLNLNITDVKSESVFVRVLDATGRMVYSNRFATAGSLNTIIEFPATLSSGMYMVECTVDGELKTERLVVE